MPLYVLALTDAPVVIGRSDRRILRDVEIGGIHAICERRDERPPLTDSELRRQHAAVIAIAGSVRAILPARFGALLRRDQLTRLIRTHEAELRRALEEVRDRVQMTVRVLGLTPAPAGTHASSGRQYLEERRRAAALELPPRARAFVDAVRPLAVRERYERGAAGLLVTIYHLVDVANVTSYAAAAVRMADASTITSGPWPPFAFTPPLF